ncbi:MAG: hydrogenase formation protein HypD [Gammaproteobacteria bacterium]|nr:hydrogenase formation protein HypD [Gammaproteobacteria bacterium]
MSGIREALGAIESLQLERRVRVLHVCGDQERVIELSGLRRQLPDFIDVVSGPGCAASVCPEADVYQALQLVQRHPVTLLVGENLLRLPLNSAGDGPRSLADAMSRGQDIQAVATPIEAVMAAREKPWREMVYFVAGFETLLGPLAGMVLEGLPDNLSLLLCGRRAEPLVDQLLSANAADFDALLLPGNRCALTGTDDWGRLSNAHGKPAAIAGYTVSNILSALHAVLQRLAGGDVEILNFYRTLVRPEGNVMARDQIERVFEFYAGDWRGLGAVDGTGLRLRRPYDLLNADSRFPDYRHEMDTQRGRMPDGCDCADVLRGRVKPSQCALFAKACTPATPIGPCMASEDGTCYLQRTLRPAA